jgi:hypothetical protein
VSVVIFLLEDDNGPVPVRAVISADQKGLADLVAMFWRLLNHNGLTARVSALDNFRRINLSDIVFQHADISQMTFDGATITAQCDEKHLRIYADLVEAQIGHSQGHQYLDFESNEPSVELVVSTGEYGQDFFEMHKDRLLKRGH